MSQQHITIGTANAGGGDTPFGAFTKIESNFNDIYSTITNPGLRAPSDLRTALNAADYDNYSTLQFAGNATNTAILFSQIIELPDGRLMGFLSVFGTVLADFSQFDLKGSYSSDGGKTWSTPFTIVGIEGSEIANAIPSVYIKSNGTLVMLFWRQLGTTDPLQTSICKKTSTDNGATWSSTTTIYSVGTYSAPGDGRIFKANDGTLYYAFNQWLGGPGGSTDYQYGSQNANYKGQLLKSTDDGTTWTHLSIDITDGANNAVLEPGIYQFEDAADGTVGRTVFYYRSRGGFVGMAYSDDNFVTWTTGAPSTLAASNHDSTVLYDAPHNMIVAHVGEVSPWDFRKTVIRVSYDKGTTWFTKVITSEVPSGYNCSSAGSPYIWKGMIFFPFYKSNSTITRYDAYLYYSKVGNLTGVNLTENHTPLYNGESNSLLTSTSISAGLTVDDLIIGTGSKFNSTDVLDIRKSGGDTRVVISNDDNNQFSNILLNFRRTVAGSDPSNGCPIGEIRFNDKLSLYSSQNNNFTNSADLYFSTDTGSGLTKRASFLNSGAWMFGNGNSFVPLHTYAIANFSQASANTSVNIFNVDNNSNYNELRFIKTRSGSYALTQGDIVGSIEFGDGVGSAIKAIANGDANSGFRANDIVFYGTNSSGTQAERFRFTGNGGILINSTITAGGTTGNQTINKATGTVNIAAAGTSVTVTNSLVTTSSLVYTVIRTNDSTATIKNVVPGSGSFVITLAAAATAEVSIGFIVFN